MQNRLLDEPNSSDPIKPMVMVGTVEMEMAIVMNTAVTVVKEMVVKIPTAVARAMVMVTAMVTAMAVEDEMVM